jgi:Bacterial self-protective colicin-like immunity
MSSVIDDYAALVERFVHGGLSGDAFQTEYFERFKNETRELTEPAYQVLQTLFAEVDAFVADPDLRAALLAEDPNDVQLDEDGLRECARRALGELRALR